ncbi:MAG: hypothetical protein B5M53_04215 [Candidatus Cloacimonas sp. 4484_209]|nr:MAG: hypothetical protein B5M53_04215 [Candidatus Cloacimonas sp. 4484_209]
MHKQFVKHRILALVFFLLYVLAMFGCTHRPAVFLPPIYEERAPLIIGVAHYVNYNEINIDSLLTVIINNSDIASGVITAPFNKDIVDIIIEVNNLTIQKKTDKIFPKRFIVKGELAISVYTQDNKLIKTYTSSTEKKIMSFNPFSHDLKLKMVLSELIIDILDDMENDFKNMTFSVRHKKLLDKKREVFTLITQEYPTLTDFNKRDLFVKTVFKGRVPPYEIRMELKNKNKILVSSKLYFVNIRNVSDKKMWFYKNCFSCSDLPFNTSLHYELTTMDIMGNHNCITDGELKTISKGLFRLKRVEIITQGAIITVFGTLITLTILYSL